MKLILASSSPRRADVLRNAGFVSRSVPRQWMKLACQTNRRRPMWGASRRPKPKRPSHRRAAPANSAIVIAADTTVLVEGQILAKPEDAADARRMLRLLSGRTHEVLTALAVNNIATGQGSLQIEKTRVDIVELSDDDIESYIATGEPFDKAGAYGIQGIAGRFAARINGCYFNVMGMPLSRLWSTLQELGWKESAGA